jgi:AmmeMemoRadiSam system protein A
MAVTPSTKLDAVTRQAVLDAAAAAIDSGLGLSIATPPDARSLAPTLAELRASFVTLTLDGALRGCCGTLEAARPLLLDVWRNALASAFHDPRFPPLTLAEWRSVELEVAVLTPCERIVAADERELLAQLEPGRDGLVLSWRGVRATFLPKVWEQVSGAEEFLHRLRQKAGWPAGFWAADLEIWRYETECVGPMRAAASGQPSTG